MYRVLFVFLRILLLVDASGPFIENVFLQPNTRTPDVVIADPFATDDPTSQATVFIRRDLFVNNKDIRYYAILVAAQKAIESPCSGTWHGDIWPDIPKWENAETENGTILTYQTTPVKWEPFFNNSELITATFTIGTGECYEYSYCNKPLRQRYKYALKVRAFTMDKYQDTDVFYFETLECLPLGYISLVISGILFTGVIATIISLFHKDFFGLRLLRSAKLNSSSSSLIKSYRRSDFGKYASELLRNTGRLSNEFHLLGTLSSNLTTPCLYGQRLENREKNRYGDILPFDVTRVELSIINGDPSTDYINASFIKGYHQQIEYIAAQGPKKETSHDFYRMIIEQKIELIVMLTDLEENGTELCYRYFPDVGCSFMFEDVEVQCKFEQDKHFCTKRKLVVKSQNGEMEVIHLHVEGWPDFHCPNESGDLIKLCEYTRQIPHRGYILVHGTAGTGRSGTFIALDILLQRLKNNDKISVFNTVLDLRRQRVNMVQTLDQYAFIYKCVSDAVNTVTERCAVTEL